MIRTAFHILIFILIPFFLGAQDKQCSEPQKQSKFTERIRVVSGKEHFIVIEERDEKIPSLDVFKYTAGTLGIIWKKNIPIAQVEGVPQRLKEVLIIDQQLYLFTTGLNNALNQYEVYVNVLDDSGNIVSGPTLVHFLDASTLSREPRLVVELSPSRQKMLLLFDSSTERKARESLSLKVYSPDLDLEWDRILELPYGAEVIQVHNYRVDNEGGVYLMSGQNPVKNNSVWQRPQGSRYVVFYYNHALNKLKEYDVSLKEKQVISLQFEVNQNNELAIAGYYSNDFQFSVAGTFLFVLLPGGEGVKAAAYMAFPKDFLTRFMNQKQAERNGTLNDVFLDHLILNEDGSYYLVGEQYYITEQVMTDPATGRQIVDYRFNYDDIIVTRLKNSGHMEWNVKVPKRQFDSGQLSNGSYALFTGNDGLGLAFNDHPENAQKLSAMPQGDATAWTGGKASSTCLVRISATGDITRKNLMDNQEEGFLMRASLCTPNPSGPSFIGFEDGRSYRFCLIP